MKKLIKLLAFAPVSLFTILIFCTSCGRVPPVVVEEGLIIAQARLGPQLRNLTCSNRVANPHLYRAVDFVSRRYTNPSGTLFLDVKPNTVLFTSPAGTSYRQMIGSPSIWSKNQYFTNEEVGKTEFQKTFNKHELPIINSLANYTSTTKYIDNTSHLKMNNHLHENLASVSTVKYQPEVKWDHINKKFNIKVAYKAKSTINYAQLSSDVAIGSVLGTGSYLLLRGSKNKKKLGHQFNL